MNISNFFLKKTYLFPYLCVYLECMYEWGDAVRKAEGEGNNLKQTSC